MCGVHPGDVWEENGKDAQGYLRSCQQVRFSVLRILRVPPSDVPGDDFRLLDLVTFLLCGVQSAAACF